LKEGSFRIDAQLEEVRKSTKRIAIAVPFLMVYLPAQIEKGKREASFLRWGNKRTFCPLQLQGGRFLWTLLKGQKKHAVGGSKKRPPQLGLPQRVKG
jgi:hypothetical protein